MRQRRELDFEGKKVLVILAWSTSVLQFPEKSGVIRVKQYKQSLAIQSDGKKGSKGKNRAHVGGLARATHLKATLGTMWNAGCIFRSETGLAAEETRTQSSCCGSAGLRTQLVST